MPQYHDFVQAFRNLTAVLKQTEDTISLDNSVTEAFLHTSTPTNTDGLKEFADVILQKGLFPRLDAVAIYTVVASTLHFPPCPLLSKVVYHLLDNLLIYKDDKKATLALKNWDESIDPAEEIKKRQKTISKFLMKRMRDVLFDTKKHIRVRRLVAEVLATLCVGDERACTYLAEGENAPMLGVLLRNSTDAVLRMHLADIIRHLTANHVELNQIWDKTDEAVMDFPSSAGLSTPAVHKLFDCMHSIVAETETMEISSKIYRIKEIHAPNLVHSGSGNASLALDEHLTVFIPGKDQLFSHYEMPVRQDIDLEVTDIAGAASTLSIRFAKETGFWLYRGKKRALSAVTIQFPEERSRNAFIKDFRSVQDRVSAETPITNSTSQQETQNFSLPLLRISEDADSTDVEDVLPSSLAQPRTGKPLPPRTDAIITNAQQPPSNDVVNQRDPSSRVFEKEDATKNQARHEMSKKSRFMERVTSKSSKQKTPTLTKKDERDAQNPPDTSPLQTITGNVLRSRRAATLGVKPKSQNEIDPVLTLPMEQYGDVDFEDFNNQNIANMSETIQQSMKGDDEAGDYQSLDGLPSVQQTTPNKKHHSRSSNLPVYSTVSEDVSGSLTGEEPGFRNNKLKAGKVEPSLVRTDSVEEPVKTKTSTRNRATSKKPYVDWDEHLRSERSGEEAGGDPKKGKGATEQRNSNSANAKAKATKGRGNATKRKHTKSANYSTMKEISQNGSPKPARRSKRAAAKILKVYAEDESEDDGAEAVQDERPASTVPSQSKPKANPRKSRAAPTSQSNGIQNNATMTVSKKAEAIIINSSDNEKHSAVRNPLSRNGHNRAADKQKPTVSGSMTSYANGLEDDNDEVVQDSFPQKEDFLKRTAEPAHDVDSNPGAKISAPGTTSKENQHVRVDNTKLVRADTSMLPSQPNMLAPQIQPIQQTYSKESVARTTRRFEKVRKSTNHSGLDAAVSGPSNRTSLIHFEPRGPVNQGPSYAEIPLKSAQKDKAAERRRTSAQNVGHDLSQGNLNSLNKNTATSQRNCNHRKDERSRKTTNGESILIANMDGLTHESIAVGRLSQKQRPTESHEYMENTNEQHDEIGLFGEEAANEESNATSSAIVVNYDNHEPAIATSINAEHQSPPPVLQADHPQRSESQSDSVSNVENGSTDSSLSEASPDESEFEASLPIEQNPRREVAHHTRQTAAITDSADPKRQSMLNVANADDLPDPFTVNTGGSHCYGKMAQISGQMSAQDDVIARIARNCNPGAQNDIHLQASKPDKVTQNILSGFPRFDTDESIIHTHRLRVITNKAGSPRKAPMLKDTSMPPPPKRASTSDALQTGDRSCNGDLSRPDNNGSDNRRSKVKRVKRSVERPLTPIIDLPHQSTPLPFAARLVEASSSVSRSRTEDILENNNRSETGGTTLVDTSLFIRQDEPRSPSLLSSRPSVASGSPQPELQAHPYLSDRHERQDLSSVSNTLQRNIQQTIMAITQQICIRLDTEERLTKGLIDVYRRGCSETLSELERNANSRIKHDATKITSVVEQTKAKMQDAATQIAKLPGRQSRVDEWSSKENEESMKVCKAFLHTMLKGGRIQVRECNNGDLSS